MNKKITAAAVLLRLLLGWYMFVDGLNILLTPNWTAAGFLNGALTFPAFYAWFALPANAWWVDPLNSWGITLIGLALIVGVGIRVAGWGGAILMILYYFPHYAFPNAGTHGEFIVEEHLIYAAAFVLIALMPQARAYSLAGWLRGTFIGRVPIVRDLI